MATYMVEINSRFLVKLEIEGSALAAEHYFLDGYKGVWGAMAYDTKTMKTDTFIGAMMHDELTTVDALAAKLTDFEALDTELEMIAVHIETVRTEIKKLQETESALHEQYVEKLKEWHKADTELNATRPQ